MLKKILPLAAVAALAAYQPIHAAEYDWANTATDFGAKASYTQGGTGTIAGSNVAYFKTTPSMQPVLSASIAVGGLNFSASGYDVTGSAFILTLNGYGTSATGTTASTAAAVYSTSTGTNTFDVPVTLTSGNGTSAYTMYEMGAGGGVVFNSAVTATTNVVIEPIATSTVTFNAAGTFSSSVTVTLTGTNTGGGSSTLALGNDTALGSATLATNSSNATFAASGGARSIANPVVLGGNTTIGGSNNINLSGSVTSSGSSSRTLTISNSGTTTISGPFYLAPDNTTARGIAIGGTTALSITGVIANNGSGNTLASPLTYNGSSTLTFSGANTYTGTTTVGGTATTGGMLIVTSGGNLGSGNVTIYGGNTLTLGTGVTNAIADTAMLTLGTTATAANAILALNGTAGTSQETINTLSVNGVGMAAGTYGPIGDIAANFQLPNITGTGELTVLTSSAVPEPSTWAAALLGAGLIGASIRRFRRRSA